MSNILSLRMSPNIQDITLLTPDGTNVLKQLIGAGILPVRLELQADSRTRVSMSKLIITAELVDGVEVDLPSDICGVEIRDRRS